ncbi:MAG TPA: sigma-70 family RNA polymerase sigma factor [Chryseosolibacter sp.]|nr:sigma-70 family RNA polymerase sigma factor [Chryseosolibacter sp.]
MQGLDLKHVIDKAIAGDQAAFATIVDRHEGFVYSLSLRFLASRADAEDATQEVFIRLWKNLSRYRPDVKLSTWLYKITTNVCLDVLRSRKRRSEHRSHSIDPDEPYTHPSGADDQVLGEELKMILFEITEKLTPKQKAVFILRDLEGLEVDEVCNVLSLSAGNVKSNLYYARQKVGELVTKYYAESKGNP